MKSLIDKLDKNGNLSDDELKNLILNICDDDLFYLNKKARQKTDEIYKKEIFIRGLIEFTNYCKNNCYYCGIRAENTKAQRYRLKTEDILSCCKEGYDLGFRTFVLQGGEDLYFTDDKICDIVKKIKKNHPSCAVTLSIGERQKESYKRFFESGADRFLLRHETADKTHYNKIHPENMSFENRVECLKNLKDIGFQTGCGFMVGSPYQTTDSIIKDLRFIKEFEPEMVGIGPFIPHKHTPFGDKPTGSVRLTLILLSIIRLMLPSVLLPSTTALGTANENGRIKGILAGANVVMPNLSPKNVRDKYCLYDNKKSSDLESAQEIKELSKSLLSIGYKVAISRGDNINFKI